MKRYYEPANWEEGSPNEQVVTPVDPNDKLPPRTLIAGSVVNGKSAAYPLSALEKQRLILDNIGSGGGVTPIFVVLGDDNKSVRAFERALDGRTLEFYVKPDTIAIQIIDAETATTGISAAKRSAARSPVNN